MKLFVLSAVIISLITGNAFANSDSIEIGITFSKVQCEYLGIDWKEEYIKVLKKDFAVIRLGSYWNEIEKEEGVYDFSILDWQIKEAGKRNIPVILTVGMKAPRWPEYFIPGWLLDRIYLHHSADVSKNKLICEKVMEFIESVVLRYKDNDTVKYWQVENEPLDHTGPKRWWINKSFLKKEIDLVKKLDNRNRPVIVNCATYPNGFLRFLSGMLTLGNPVNQALDLGDILGINVYQTIGARFFGANVCYGSGSKERKKYYSRILESAAGKGKKVIVTELQAEPWDPGLLVHTGKEEAVTCSPGDTKELFSELTSLGIKTILLWGVEYWDFRAREHGETGWWDTVNSLMNKK